MKELFFNDFIFFVCVSVMCVQSDGDVPIVTFVSIVALRRTILW